MSLMSGGQYVDYFEWEALANKYERLKEDLARDNDPAHRKDWTSVESIHVHYKDGSCCVVKNHGMSAEARAEQLSAINVALEMRVSELEAERVKLWAAGDEVVEVIESQIPFSGMNAVNKWLAAKEGRDAK